MMPAPFAAFSAVVRDLAPRAAVVLGSGLAGAAAAFRESVAVPFGDVPGLVPPTVHGHRGRLAVGHWGDVPALLFHGRLHFYEGHTPEVVTGTVRVAAELGVKIIVLTNAAGGIRQGLGPGSLMAIRGHFKLIGREAWRAGSVGDRSAPVAHAPGSPDTVTPSFAEPYSPRLLNVMRNHEAAAGRELPVGVYAALTGPCYETPAEIRALAALGADAVGMSTALEAEMAAELGLEVAAVSCVTNLAAGLGTDPLDHAEVLANATLAVERLGGLIGAVIAVD